MRHVQGLSVKGVNYLKRKLSGCNYLGAIFLGGDCLGVIAQEYLSGGNCPGGNYLRWELHEE